MLYTVGFSCLIIGQFCCHRIFPCEIMLRNASILPSKHDRGSLPSTRCLRALWKRQLGIGYPGSDALNNYSWRQRRREVIIAATRWTGPTLSQNSAKSTRQLWSLSFPHPANRLKPGYRDSSPSLLIGFLREWRKSGDFSLFKIATRWVEHCLQHGCAVNCSHNA